MRQTLGCELRDDEAAAAPGAIDTMDFRFGDRDMRFLLGHRCTGALVEQIAGLTDHVVLVADARVHALWGAELIRALRTQVGVSCIRVEAAETGKSLDRVQAILDEAVDAGATRRSVVVSFGGGLTGNLAGLAAGLLFRGVRLVHVPTTLLAMSDSVLSQKQAVNGRHAKNLYGLYHPAQLSCVDVQYLQTLPQTEFSAGVVELCKNGLAFDTASLPYYDAIAARADPAAWCALVKLGVAAKQRLLDEDPFEQHRGVVLEYGHTVGHALELETGTLTHGHAVGLGMLVAAAISRARGWLTEEEEARHADLLCRARAPVTLPGPVDAAAVVERVRRDNKRGRIALKPREHAFVLLKHLGRPAVTGGLPLVPVDEAELLDGFAKLASGHYADVGGAR
ncbi:2-deoxy-scyllo-inosose synthase [Burkholderia alba]|uniref:2-deoxy-scyllo-inosose synthase n=1 Tax=Burkholderia alba TaxID=2683677 RepID=UPI002B0602EB|nr:2-deoxy-scyllo-inosose synthase [Burkholderia alba]